MKIFEFKELLRRIITSYSKAEFINITINVLFILTRCLLDSIFYYDDFCGITPFLP